MAFAASVGEAILLQFQAYAEQAVEKGADVGDAAYEQLLDGLQAAAIPAGGFVMAQLLSWREGLLAGLRKQNDAITQRKRLTIEALFLEGTARLVGAAPGMLSTQQGADLEAVAFDWLLGADAYLSFPDPYRHKDRVVLAAAEMLGALSPLRLAALGQRWEAELGKLIRADANSPARQQLYDLCHGMRFVRISGASNVQLEASLEFLRRAHPLTHVAPDKKSRVQQAICDMLAGILQPLADNGEPGEFGAGCDADLRQKFAQQVTVLRSDLQKWSSKQSKQVMSGVPVVAVLMCLEGHDQLVTTIDGFIDQLHKLLRDRRAASMALLCLTRVVSCFLRRMAARSDAARMAKWLSRGVAPVIQAMMRGQLPAAEQQELVRQLCASVAQTLPEFALSGMVLELLQVDLQAGTNWEAPMAGLMALLTILTSVPGRLAGRQLTLELQATAAGLEKAVVGVWVPPPGAISQLLELVKQGYNPLDSYGAGALGQKVSAALGRLVTACHQLYGFSRVTSMLKTSDAAARERLGALPVFVMALQCVPFVMPEHWTSGAICEDLPGYTIHSEASMRQVSQTVLRRCMRSLPGLRDKMVAAFAAFVVRIQEDYPEVIKDSLALLLSLLREWTTLAVGEWTTPQAGGRAKPLAGLESIHRVEGSALVLLCSPDVEVRRLGLELMRTARDLHRALSTPPQPSSKRSTMHHVGDGAGAATRRVGLSSAGGAGSMRRATATHGSAVLLESVPNTPGSSPKPVYAADIIEQKGQSVVAHCYWDFGRWSDLWRAWRPLPEAGATFDECLMRTRTQEDATRWARIVCELLREVWALSEKSAWVAHLELISKLQGLLSLDSNGRQVLPPDAKTDLSRCYSLALAAAPLLDSSRLGERSLTSRELVRLLVASVRSSAEVQQATAVLALGGMHPACHALVLKESAVLADDYLDRQMQRSITMPSVPGMGRKAVKKDDVRLAHAHLTRMLADNLPPGSLADNVMVRDKLIEFVKETARHITSNADVSPEVQQLRYCLCAVARQVGIHLGNTLPQAFPVLTRRALYDLFGLYCEEAQTPGQFKNDLRRIIAQAKARIKDADAGRMVEADLVDSSEVLEHAAYLGMAAMLVGPLFSSDVANPQGRVFAWIDRMLSAPHMAARPGDWGPPKGTVARSALTNMLQSNSELASVFVDRSYAANQQVAAGYFQVLTEVYAARPLPLPEYVCVSLVLNKIVDPQREVRDAARGLLSMMSRRVWGRDPRYSEQHETAEGPSAAAAAAGLAGVHRAPAGADGTVVVGSLANSYAAYQLRLSARLAKEHTALSDPVAIEVLGRQLANPSGPGALLSLCSWLEYVTIPTQWQGHWSENLLDSLYSITAKQTDRGAHEQLWATLAANRLSIVPALNFLIDRGLREDAAGGSAALPAATGKEIVVYLSRVAARQVVGHLVHEAMQQIAQPDPAEQQDTSSPYAARTPDGHTPKILEYHHKRTKSSLLHRQLPALTRISAGSILPSGEGGGPGSSAGSRPSTPGGSRHGGGGGSKRASMFEHLLRSQSLWSDAGAVPGEAMGAAPFPGGSSGGAALGGAPMAAPGALSKSASMSDARSSFDSRQNSLSRQRDGNGAAAAAAAEAAHRLPLSRPEMALSLLIEVAYEQDEEFRQHLPQLLHLCLTSADSANPLVRRDSQQLLVYLLYSLSLKHLEAAQNAGALSPEGQGVAEVVAKLQARLGQQLWPREQPSLAHPMVPSASAVAVFVQTVTECFVFDRELRDQWCAEALRWTCGARSRHAASRSHQAFCALRPVLGAQSASAMLAALHKCLAPGRADGSDTGSLDTAVEVLCSLRALLAGLLADPVKSLLYPQLLLACIALLQSSVVRVVELAMHLLLQLLAVVDLNDPIVQNTMLAMLPLPEDGKDEGGGGGSAGLRSPAGLREQWVSSGGGGTAEMDAGLPLEGALWPLGQGLLGGSAEPEVEEALGPWLALQQLVVKALFQPETELLALQLLGAIAGQVARSDAAAQQANNAAGGGSEAAASDGGESAWSCGGGGSGGADLFSCLSLADGLLLAAADGSGAAAPIEAVLGDLRAGMAIALGASLPWLCVHLREVGPEAVLEGFLEASAGACAALGWLDLADALLALAGMAGTAEEPEQWLPPFCAALCGALFPTYSRLLLQRLMEVAQRGAERYQQAAITAMRAVFQVPGLDLGPSGWPAHDPPFIQQLSAHLAGPLSGAVLEALKAMLRFQSPGAAAAAEEADDEIDSLTSLEGEEDQEAQQAQQQAQQEVLEWPHCMDDLGGSNKLCSEALERVIWACPGSAQLLWGNTGSGAGGGARPVSHSSRDSFLPFLP
ncbi:hypothetical protein D9Q98_001435 [Chlorella vulgaris]|uniref:Uncharacterized protein n=1 Tax=Chlorella vulgaris TaxID=3077 RepID=A0A9D4U0K9_CHLVU|nr:hypothetical protein D9Q98_001435 [Chlorella vulgaris]